MDAVEACLERLKELGNIGQGDPRDAAAQIVQDFKMRATRAEIQQLTNRLENARVIGLSTVVPTHHLTQHSRWLAVVEGARAAVLSPQADEGPAS